MKGGFHLGQPLAYRMRPKQIDDVIGQQHLLGQGKPLWRMIQSQCLQSMILFGPPGTGKTSIASAISGSLHLPFRQLNAATDSKKDLQHIIQEAELYDGLILLLDEIHRLDKTKQDFLLPHLESGRIILIGATTENPYIAINRAIRSRVQLFELYPLTAVDIQQALQRAMERDAILQNKDIEFPIEEQQQFSQKMNGDLRKALNIFEMCVLSTAANEQGKILITAKDLIEAMGLQPMFADKNGDEHYHLLSAFQKSIRGSDVDAALYYLARLIINGDIKSIQRRLLVIAYEDIGLANPNATARTLAAVEASDRLGFPEARIPLANAVIDLCLSPKSNSSVKSIDLAIKEAKQYPSAQVPNHLKDGHYEGAAERGHAQGYQYPHDTKEGWVQQQYLPAELQQHTYYQYKQTGRYERALVERYQQLQSRK